MTLQTEAINYKEGDVLDHTPGSALVAGQLLEVAGRPVMAVTAIAANALGAVQVKGILKVTAAAVVGNIGDNVFWDENGTPVGGSTTGALTTIQTDGDFWLGTLAEALAAADGVAKVMLGVANIDQPAWLNKVHELKADNYTVDALDAGKVLHIATDAKAFTLLATVAGLRLIFVNDGADAAVALTISPNANDKIMGPDIAGTDNKDQVNTKTTAIHGDYMVLVGDGADGWWIEEMRGTWAEES